MSRPSHSFLFDHPNSIRRAVKIMNPIIMQFPPPPVSFCFLVSGSDTLLSTLF
jgi:hypothetical protein